MTFGYFSKKAEAAFGAVIWTTPSGSEVEITGTGHHKEPKQSGIYGMTRNVSAR